ncbi:MAG: hypothetical protein R3D33_05390 [Hyphomicrobiaceae bacterium]
MLVHFPIVFVITLAALDVVLLARGRGWPAAAALPTSRQRLRCWPGSRRSRPMCSAMSPSTSPAPRRAEATELHETLGSIGAAVLAIWALVRGWLWWRDRPAGGGVRGGIAVVELAMVALVLATAYAGGQLVFDYGVNVGRIAG